MKTIGTEKISGPFCQAIIIEPVEGGKEWEREKEKIKDLVTAAMQEAGIGFGILKDKNEIVFVSSPTGLEKIAETLFEGDVGEIQVSEKTDLC